MMLFSNEEVLIFTDSSKEPVFQMSKMELSKSRFLTKLVNSLNFCDGCREPVTIFISGEEKQTVVSSLSQLSAKKSGLSIIVGNYNPKLLVI